MSGNKNDLDQLVRKAHDLVLDLHEHKLAIPAGLLVVLILAAVFVLPKGSTPPPAVTPAPAASSLGPEKQATMTEKAKLQLVTGLPLSANARTYRTENPFSVRGSSSCKQITKSPKAFLCMAGDVPLIYVCLKDDPSETCKGSGSGGGSSGETGGSTGGGTGTGDTGGGGGGGGDSGGSEVTIYVADVEYDGKTYNNLESGDSLPQGGDAIVFYAGPNSSGSKATFLIGDGVTMQGAELDEDLGSFQLSEDDEVILTDSSDVVHNLLLKDISKVTK